MEADRCGGKPFYEAVHEALADPFYRECAETRHSDFGVPAAIVDRGRSGPRYEPAQEEVQMAEAGQGEDEAAQVRERRKDELAQREVLQFLEC